MRAGRGSGFPLANPKLDSNFVKSLLSAAWRGMGKESFALLEFEVVAVKEIMLIEERRAGSKVQLLIGEAVFTMAAFDVAGLLSVWVEKMF